MLHGKNSKDFSLVIPVYKNFSTLGELHSSLERLFKILDQQNKISGEVVYVVDGSPDASISLLQDLQKKSSIDSTIIELSKNFGQTPAILAGLEEIKGKSAIVMSADLQDPLELIQEMLRMWIQGDEIVICHRTSRDDSISRSITSSIAYKVFHWLEPQMPRGGFDFFLASGEVVEKLIEIRGRYRFLQSDLLSLGYNVSFIPYHRSERLSGKSSYTFIMRMKIFSDSLFESGRFPIKTTFGLGLGIMSLGLFLSLLSISNYFFGNRPLNGFTAIYCSVLILGGIQILTLSVIGQFIYRNYDISRGRRSFIVKKIHRHD
jgi:glycosyltransferase involved in cell wall biosynthesis